MALQARTVEQTMVGRGGHLSAQGPSCHPGIYTTSVSAVAEGASAVESVAAVCDAIALDFAGTASIPVWVKEVSLAVVLLTIEAFRTPEAETIRLGAAFATTLHQVTPVATVKGHATVGDAVASNAIATRIVTVFSLVEEGLGAVEPLWTQVASAI